jgi:hypothetical protein
MRRRIVEVFDSDKLFRIKHGAGLLDFSVIGGTGLLWVFPDGTTSTASLPAKTVTAGETLLYCDNWSAATLRLNDSSTNANYLGDLSDLPALANYLSLTNCSNITGDLSDLPALTNTLSLTNCTKITGDLSDLPALTYALDLTNCSNITGDLSDLPALANYLSLTNCSNITGDLSDLPALTYYLSLSGCTKITGGLSDLPALTDTLNLYNCTKITGDLSDLPALTYYLSLSNCTKITGDLSDLPALANYLSLTNCSNITGVYSAVNANNVPTTTNLSNTGLSASDMDNTLIAYAACTKDNGSFTAEGMTRTAASDDAVTALSGRGWSITGITKV